MVASLNYFNDQELPDIVWDLSREGIDFSTGWTFSMRLARTTARATMVREKTAGFTSTATTVTAAITAATDWAGLEAATTGTAYYVTLYARRNSDSKDLAVRVGDPYTLKLHAAVGTVAATGTAVSWPWVTAQPVNAQTGTTYTAVTADRGYLVTMNNAAASTLTIDATTALSAGERIDIVQLGAGQVTIVASGVTVNATPGLKLRARYSAATLLCISAGVYLLVGDLSA